MSMQLVQARNSPVQKKPSGAVTLRPQIQIVTVAGNGIIRNAITTPSRILAPRTTTQIAPVRIAPQTRVQSPGQIVLPQGIRQNAVIMKSDQGQWVLLQSQTAQRTNATTVQPLTTLVRPAQQSISHTQQENTKKCKNFLQTLLKLASNQPQSTINNVRRLIQNLIDNVMKPEEFTRLLQNELKSSPQPYLVPFLNKSLPLLRNAMLHQGLVIEGIKPPKTVSTVQTIQAPSTPKIIKQNVSIGNIEKVSTLSTITKPIPSPVTAVSPIKIKNKYESSKDDDEFNDVATMGGVNLTEESQNLASVKDFGTVLRTYKDELLLSTTPLESLLSREMLENGLDIEQDKTSIVKAISDACQLRLTQLMEKLIVLSEHRMELYKGRRDFELTSDVRSQLRFIEEVDKVEKKRVDEAEKEQMMRVAKSRSKNEDPEQAKLKQKAKEFQQWQAEELRQKEANETALAAIGSRKRRLEGEKNNELNSPANSNHAGIQNLAKGRRKRITIKEVLHIMENDKYLAKSKLAYEMALK
ncbi:DgyrCDS4271 [Dimorphilus gyrociliatus]|uniref:DgyrCDS4271 n=1 Tax=Dimorphilus gyrociliatus TaxID=2664684 RepID=A0A7I8VIP0_9ANNE|nr:DgyrCDS4271 [Dimorphilus gyrociliatus]